MTPEELPDFLRALRTNVQTSARDVVMAMANAYRDHVRDHTLTHYQHPPGTWTTSPRYVGPPAWVSGDLSRSIQSRSGVYTDSWAMASVGPYIVYGRIQELGGVITHKTANWLHWVNLDPRTGEWTSWFRKSVYLPPRPYLEPAAKEMIADGSLSKAAGDEFMLRVWS